MVDQLYPQACSMKELAMCAQILADRCLSFIRTQVTSISALQKTTGVILLDQIPISSGDPVPSEVLQSLSKILTELKDKNVWEQWNAIEIAKVKYYLELINRLATPDFVPTAAEVLKARSESEALVTVATAKAHYQDLAFIDTHGFGVHDPPIGRLSFNSDFAVDIIDLATFGQDLISHDDLNGSVVALSTEKWINDSFNSTFPYDRRHRVNQFLSCKGIILLFTGFDNFAHDFSTRYQIPASHSFEIARRIMEAYGSQIEFLTCIDTFSMAQDPDDGATLSAVVDAILDEDRFQTNEYDLYRKRKVKA